MQAKCECLVKFLSPWEAVECRTGPGAESAFCYCSAYTPSVTLRVPAPSGREPFGVRMRLTGSRSGPLPEGAGWPSGQTEGVYQGNAELYRHF